MLLYQPGMTLAEVELKVIQYALRFHENNKTKAAQSLGISIRTIDNKLNKVPDEPEKTLRSKTVSKGS